MVVENDIWTIKGALDWTMGYLTRKGDENPLISAQWLLAEATGMRRIELYTHFEQPLSRDERDVLRGYVARRGAGEPLQYITGEVAFRHIALKVRAGVLIPRPETEVLVSEGLACLPSPPRPRIAEGDKAIVEDAAPSDGAVWAEDVILGPEDNERIVQAVYLDQGDTFNEARALSQDDAVGERRDSAVPSAPLVADIGTGSGCIACSLAFEHPQARVVATDIAPEAVELARENIAALGLSDRVQVVTCDLGEGVDAGLMGSFDLVISNPPYIPTSILAAIPREVVDFEPSLALDGGDDGLDVLRRLLPWCARALKPGGAFAFELYEEHLDEAASRAREAGFEDVRIVPDLACRPRVLVGRRPA